jgi:8-oxo-dGTP diphosphatase
MQPSFKKWLSNLPFPFFRLRSLPKTPSLMADSVLLAPSGRVLLVRRGSEPYKGKQALPGGFVNIGETVENACRREIREETGVNIDEKQLQLIGVYSDPQRDPRGHIVSIAFAAILSEEVKPRAGSDAQGANWIDNWRDEDLAFNHSEIIADAKAKTLGEAGT